MVKNTSKSSCFKGLRPALHGGIAINWIKLQQVPKQRLDGGAQPLGPRLEEEITILNS